MQQRHEPPRQAERPLPAKLGPEWLPARQWLPLRQVGWPQGRLWRVELRETHSWVGVEPRGSMPRSEASLQRILQQHLSGEQQLQRSLEVLRML